MIEKKLENPYLNIFQCYPERINSKEEDNKIDVRAAIEDNLTRAFVICLDALNEEKLMPKFLKILAGQDKSENGQYEINMQTWPNENDVINSKNNLLIGVSSNTVPKWTPNGRPRAGMTPRADVYIKSSIDNSLIIFEFKTDNNTLDATQIADYGLRLGIISENELVEKGAVIPKVGESYDKEEQADSVKKLLESKEKFLNLCWSDLIKRLVEVRELDEIKTKPVLDYLLKQCIEYLKSHMNVEYSKAEPIDSILQQLTGKKINSRRLHLMRMLQTFVDDIIIKGFKPDVKGLGASSVARVIYTPSEGGTPNKLLGTPNLVLWFEMDEENPIIGAELYIQSSGANLGLSAISKDMDVVIEDWKIKWSTAMETHKEKRKIWEKNLFGLLEKYKKSSFKFNLTDLCYYGLSNTWQRGGVAPIDQLDSGRLSYYEFKTHYENNADSYWVFPEWDDNWENTVTVRDKAKLIRKPALSIVIEELNKNEIMVLKKGEFEELLSNTFYKLKEIVYKNI